MNFSKIHFQNERCFQETIFYGYSHFEKKSIEKNICAKLLYKVSKKKTYVKLVFGTSDNICKILLKTMLEKKRKVLERLLEQKKLLNCIHLHEIEQYFKTLKMINVWKKTLNSNEQ